MIYFRLGLLICVLSLLMSAAEDPVTPTANAGADQPGQFEHYQGRQLVGWKLYVHDDLLRDQAKAVDAAVALLQGQLEEIVRVVPAAAVAKLQKVALWFSPKYPDFGAKAEYHPGLDWLVKVGRKPFLHKGIEFTNIPVFARDCERMPMLALHELSHGFHDQVYGFNYAKLMKLYEKAKANGSYDSVERYLGPNRPRKHERAYAMSTPMEYFAEATEAYFGKNDWYPYTRDELHVHDPELELLVEKMWNLEQ